MQLCKALLPPGLPASIPDTLECSQCLNASYTDRRDAKVDQA